MTNYDKLLLINIDIQQLQLCMLHAWCMVFEIRYHQNFHLLQNHFISMFKRLDEFVFFFQVYLLLRYNVLLVFRRMKRVLKKGTSLRKVARDI